MQKHVVYYYFTIGVQSESVITDNFFVLDQFPLAGLSNPRNSKKVGIGLRAFELQQENLFSLIIHAENLNIQLLRVEFDDIDYELEDELKEAIENKSATNISGVISIIRSQNFDINAVTYNYEGRQYRVTKYAVAEIIGDWKEIPRLTVDSPLAMIIGIKKFPAERSFGY